MTTLASHATAPAAPAPTDPSRTHRPQGAPDPAPERRRVLGGTRISDALALVGSGVAALSLTAVIATQLAPVQGTAACVAIATVLFLVVYATVVSLDADAPAVRDRVVMVVVNGLAFVVMATLVLIVTFTFGRGLRALAHANFFTQDMSLAGPLDPLTTGGVAHAIVGSLIQISIALAITIPLGLTTAVFLTEVPGRFSRLVRTVVEAMTALPSIVAGLFVYATAILTLGLDKSGLAASMAISIMMLPIMIRSADVVLRLVPGTLKEASYGLGSGQWRTVWKVVLPTARSGLTTAIILATARGIGETSPVLLTSGFTAAFNANPLHGPMVSLPLAIFQLVKSPEPTMIARGFGTAAVLMMVVVLLFVLARVIGAQDASTRARRAETYSRVLDAIRVRPRPLTSLQPSDGPADAPPDGTDPVVARYLPTPDAPTEELP